jgi:hypothetical protein
MQPWMEAGDRHADAGRRLLWFRLVFYPLAIGLAALALWHGRAPGDDFGDPTASLVGSTSQGEPISVSLAGVRPVAFSTHLRTSCPTGRHRGYDWWPAAGEPVPFHVDGSRLRVRETGDRRWSGGVRSHLMSTLDATVGAGRANGTLRGAETITWPDGKTMTCSTGPIRFSATLQHP